MLIKGVTMKQKICLILTIFTLACGKKNFTASPLPLINSEKKNQESITPIKPALFLATPATLTASFQNTEGKLWSLTFNSQTMDDIKKSITADIYTFYHEEKFPEMMNLATFIPCFAFNSVEFLNLKAQVESIIENDDQLIFPEVELNFKGIKSLQGRKLTLYQNGKLIDLASKVTIEKNQLVIKTNQLKQFLDLLTENSILGFKDQVSEHNLLIWDGVNLETRNVNDIKELDPDMVTDDGKILVFRNIYSDEKNGHWELKTLKNQTVLIYLPTVMTSSKFDLLKQFKVLDNKKFDLKSELSLNRGDEVTVELSDLRLFLPFIKTSKRSISVTGDYLIEREFSGNYEENKNHGELIKENFHVNLDEAKLSMMIFKYENGYKTESLKTVRFTLIINKLLSESSEIPFIIANQFFKTYIGYEKHSGGQVENASEFSVQNQSQFTLNLMVKRKI